MEIASASSLPSGAGSWNRRLRAVMRIDTVDDMQPTSPRMNAHPGRILV